ncbi:diphthine--ammonia ligase [Falsibacillus pallidus]|uniref:Uncharacterized protein (TIGR00290 family) n=1 Tax=Falsibacillus pallidus TaxID=493781 RepID=A0A370GDW1_9BACI|nr:diphthine--ammonia ligase [Falsibacillus pallidus]RDI41988.1 uncharacterized protein (TIGR00290 family) [Falsibacillus pallidus]
MDKKKVCVSWSGGRDSSLMLYRLLNDPGFEVSCLMTTVNEDTGKVMMHDIPYELLKDQAKSLGIPLRPIWLGSDPANEEYESRMQQAVEELIEDGIALMAFGDLFLEDIRKYREKNLEGTGLSPIFPLWGLTSADSSQAFLDAGFNAAVVCVDGSQLDPSFTGASYTAEFLDSLPEGVDPCGENGEFHTFVYDGPIFKEPVDFRFGSSYVKDGRFWYADILPSMEG